MSKRRVIVCPPYGTGNRRMGIGGQMRGTTFNGHALAVFPQDAGPTGQDGLDDVESGWIAWAAGGPEVWRS